MRRLLTLSIIYLLFDFSFAQSPRMDSLESALKNVTTIDSSYVNALVDLSSHYQFRSIDRSKNYADRALNTARNIRYKKGEMYALQRLGRIYRGLNNYSKSFEYYHESKRVANEIGDSHVELEDAVYIGSLHFYLGNFDEAILAFLAEIKLARKYKNLEFEYIGYFETGMSYFKQQKYDSSIFYLMKSREGNIKANNQKRQAITDVGMGDVFLEQGMYTEALIYLQEAYVCYEKLNSRVGKGVVLNYKAKGLLKQGSIQEAIEILREAKLNNSDTHTKIHLLQTYNLLGQAFHALSEFDSATNNLLKVADLSSGKGLTQEMNDAYCLLSEIAFSQKEYAKAYQYVKMCKAYSDTIYSNEKNKKLAEMQLRLERESKEKEIVVMQEKQTVSNIYMITAFILTMLLGFISYLVIARQRISANKDKELAAKEKVIYEEQRAVIELELKNKKLSEESLINELDYRSKELTAYTINLIHKNEMLESIKTQVNLIKGSSDTELKENLAALSKAVSYSINLDRDWDNFKIHFEQVHQSFFDKLKERYAELSPYDLKLCALIRLNMDTKQIATLLGISIESTKVARSRIRKKLGLQLEQNLQSFLLDI